MENCIIYGTTKKNYSFTSKIKRFTYSPFLTILHETLNLQKFTVVTTCDEIANKIDTFEKSMIILE